MGATPQWFDGVASGNGTKKPEGGVMERKLNGKRIAILVANGFEQVELTEPQDALEDAGAETEIISPEEKKVYGWEETDWGKKFKVDVPLAEANFGLYDALLL